MCVSDSEVDEEERLSSKLDSRKSDPKASRHSCRGEAVKRVNYNTRYHPQDKEILGFRRPRTMQSEEDDAGARTLWAKRRKIIK